MSQFEYQYFFLGFQEFLLHPLNMETRKLGQLKMGQEVNVMRHKNDKAVQDSVSEKRSLNLCQIGLF